MQQIAQATGGTQMAEMITSASRNASGTGRLALAATEVVWRRMALGGRAMMDPAGADHGEFARMVPEKARAFTDAGSILIDQTALIGQELARFLVDEAMIATRVATDALAGRMSVADVATQAEAAMAGLGRLATRSGAICLLALTAQADALASIHRVAADNVERLRT